MTLRALATCLALAAAPACADTLATPTGPVVLVVSGQIAHTNADGTAQFDVAMLREIEARTVETSTIWTDGTRTFTGVSLNLIMETVGARGDQIKATAINDYTVTIPLTDAVSGGPLVAYEMDGAIMSRRDKGPLWIVYPYDSSAEFRTEVIYARSIWQLDRIEVLD